MTLRGYAQKIHQDLAWTAPELVDVWIDKIEMGIEHALRDCSHLTLMDALRDADATSIKYTCVEKDPDSSPGAYTHRLEWRWEDILHYAKGDTVPELADSLNRMISRGFVPEILHITWERKTGAGLLDTDRTAPRESDGYDRTPTYVEAKVNGWTLVAYVGGFFYLCRPDSSEPLISGNTRDGFEDAKTKVIQDYEWFSKQARG